MADQFPLKTLIEQSATLVSIQRVSLIGVCIHIFMAKNLQCAKGTLKFILLGILVYAMLSTAIQCQINED